MKKGVVGVRSYIKDGSGVERFGGYLKEDKKPIAWVSYLDPFNPNRKVIAVCSSVGCVGRCRFCKSGRTRPFSRRLSVEEINAQILHCFTRRGLTVNFAGEGDCVCSNMENACRAAEIVLGMGLQFSFIFTTIGHEKNLEDFLKRHGNLPVTFYWSLNFATRDQRAYFMPGTNWSSIEKLRDIFQKISCRTGKKTTVSWVVMRGLNDSPSDVELLKRYFGGRPEFEIKLMALERGSLSNITTTEQDVERFATRLKKASLPYRIRKILGGKIKAGCGTTVPLLA